MLAARTRRLPSALPLRGTFDSRANPRPAIAHRALQHSGGSRTERRWQAKGEAAARPDAGCCFLRRAMTLRPVATRRRAAIRLVGWSSDGGRRVSVRSRARVSGTSSPPFAGFLPMEDSRASEQGVSMELPRTRRRLASLPSARVCCSPSSLQRLPLHPRLARSAMSTPVLSTAARMPSARRSRRRPSATPSRSLEPAPPTSP